MIICVLILKQILHKKKVIFIQLIESPILPYFFFCKYIFGQLLKWTEFVIICRIKSSTVPISLRVLNNIVEKPSSSIVFTSWILQRVWMSAAAAVDLNWVSEAPLPNTLLMVLMSSCILLPIPIPIPILCWWCWCHPAICILRPIPIPNWAPHNPNTLLVVLMSSCNLHPQTNPNPKLSLPNPNTLLVVLMPSCILILLHLTRSVMMLTVSYWTCRQERYFN